MGRPSLTEQRVEEILDAFEICVARYGTEGATLEKVAEQAGLARALIRHNVGNRDELLATMVERFLARMTRESDELFESLPRSNRIETLIDWLFDPKYADTHVTGVFSALFTAAYDRPELAKSLRGWMGKFVKSVESELRRVYPDAPEDRFNPVATGIVSIYFNFDSMAPLGRMPDFRENSSRAALLLSRALETEIPEGPDALV